MRLTCPSCGAEYDIPEGMLPAAGRHAQCSACHTRWFVRGAARDTASEDQILTRLENWRPRPVAVPLAAPRGEAPARPRPAEPLRVVPPPPAEPAEATAAAPAPPSPAPRPAAPVAALAKGEPPTKPADRPTVARPAAISGAPARSALRLDLDAPKPPPEPAPPPRSRFLRGFLVVLVPVLLAFAAYRFEGEIATAVPAAEPALDAYAAAIDGWRDDLEGWITPLRPGRDG